MSYTKDSRVDDYIIRLPDWQQAICQEVRELVQATRRAGAGCHRRDLDRP